MPITLSKLSYATRSIEHFEALEQTLRLRLVSGLVDEKFFFSVGIASPVQYTQIIFTSKNGTNRQILLERNFTAY
jgi:hypothetical protein